MALLSWLVRPVYFLSFVAYYATRNSEIIVGVENGERGAQQFESPSAYTSCFAGARTVMGKSCSGTIQN
jgi:hypothetical protein